MNHPVDNTDEINLHSTNLIKANLANMLAFREMKIILFTNSFFFIDTPKKNFQLDQKNRNYLIPNSKQHDFSGPHSLCSQELSLFSEVSELFELP